MVMVINGSGISGLDGSTSAPTLQGTDTNTGIYFPALDTVGVVTNGTERLRVDSSGNVGIGVTPSAWDVGFNVVEGSGGSFFSGSTGAVRLGGNMYYNSGYKFKASNIAATRLELNNGQFRFYQSTDATQTAGAAITFNQAMTLDASGRLLVGTTTPVTKVTVSGNTGDGITYTDGTAQNFFGTSSALGSLGTLTNHPLQIFTNGAERMRIDTSGNLGIGTVSPSQKLHLASAASAGNIYALIDSSLTANGYNAATLYKNDQRMFRVGVLGTVGGFTNGALVVYDETAAAWRMVIDSSGSLIIGDTGISAGNERVRIKSNGSTSSTAGIQIINFAGTELFFVRSDGAFRTGSASVSPYNNTVGSGANLFVNTDGTLLRSTSSLKYKTDVNDATHGLADVMNLRSVTYKGKNNEVDGDNIYGGLIAEEVHEAGLTEFIQYAEDGTPDGIYYGNMVGLLVKAIQELKAEFDAYKASHP